MRLLLTFFLLSLFLFLFLSRLSHFALKMDHNNDRGESEAEKQIVSFAAFFVLYFFFSFYFILYDFPCRVWGVVLDSIRFDFFFSPHFFTIFFFFFFHLSMNASRFSMPKRRRNTIYTHTRQSKNYDAVHCHRRTNTIFLFFFEFTLHTSARCIVVLYYVYRFFSFFFFFWHTIPAFLLKKYLYDFTLTCGGFVLLVLRVVLILIRYGVCWVLGVSMQINRR